MLGLNDLYDVAHVKEDILYRTFGINAEYIIDHSKGIEPVTIADIKAYKPSSNSISNSQILFEDYSYEDAFLVMKEMVDSNVLTLTEKHLVTNHISLYIGYSKNIIKPSSGSMKITNTTNSCSLLMEEFIKLYKRIVIRGYPIRQIGIAFGNVKDEIYEQLDIFADIDDIEKEKKIQESLVKIREKYGKNAVLKGMNYYDRATMRKRNGLIGGHNAA